MVCYVFTDGGVIGNGKSHALGGVGVWFGDDDPRNQSHGFANTPSFKVTNQTMELLAATLALEACPVEGQVMVYTDSMYTINCVTKWIAGWRRNGWNTATGGPVLNRPLIERLHALVLEKRASFVHVPSHRPTPPLDSPGYAMWRGNFEADRLATKGINSMRSRSVEGRGRDAMPTPGKMSSKKLPKQQHPLTHWFKVSKFRVVD